MVKAANDSGPLPPGQIKVFGSLQLVQLGSSRTVKELESTANSLFLHINSLFLEIFSLLTCVGNCSRSGCGIETFLLRNQLTEPKIAKFPVKFPVSREFARRQARSPLRRQRGSRVRTGVFPICRRQRTALAQRTISPSWTSEFQSTGLVCPPDRARVTRKGLPPITGAL